MKFCIDKSYMNLHQCVDNDPLSITEIIVPEGVKFIDEDAFSGFDNVERMVFPTSCVSYEPKATQNKPRLTELIIPSVDNFGHYPFRGCDSLLEFTVPECVRVLYPFAFGGAVNLKKLIFPSLDNFERADYAAFRGTPRDTEIVYPEKTEKPIMEYDSSMGEYSFPDWQRKKLSGKSLMAQAREFFMQAGHSETFDHNGFHLGYINGFFDEFPKVKALIKDGDTFVGYVIKAYDDKQGEKEVERILLAGNTVPYCYERETDTSGDNNGAGYKGGEDYYSRIYLTLTYRKDD